MGLQAGQYQQAYEQAIVALKNGATDGKTLYGIFMERSGDLLEIQIGTD